MINNHSIQKLQSSNFLSEFRKPIYDDYSFTQIPKTIKRLLLGTKEGLPQEAVGSNVVDHIIAICIDGFGWSFLQKYKERFPFLKRFEKEGIVNMISSQFPSTTVAHMTCLHTDLPVGEHGIYEWFYYEPILDACIAPLLFSFAGDCQRETLKDAGVTVPQLFPFSSFYEDLKKHGVHSYIYKHQTYCNSTYSEWVCRGAELIPFKTTLDALEQQLNFSYKHEKTYQFIYFAEIDTLSHNYGPTSPQFETSVEETLTALESWFLKLSKSKKNIAVLVFADHGHMALDPSNVVYINELFPEILPKLKTNDKGQFLAPCGSSRDLFLHVRDEHLLDVKHTLEKGLKDIASVCEVKELASQGFFGKKISDRFHQRMADLVILPYAEQQVWWFEEGRFDCHYHGSHGGLSSDEMESIFLFLKI